MPRLFLWAGGIGSVLWGGWRVIRSRELSGKAKRTDNVGTIFGQNREAFVGQGLLVLMLGTCAILVASGAFGTRF
jgi:hypothetical protein